MSSRSTVIQASVCLCVRVRACRKDSPILVVAQVAALALARPANHHSSHRSSASVHGQQVGMFGWHVSCVHVFLTQAPFCCWPTAHPYVRPDACRHVSVRIPVPHARAPSPLPLPALGSVQFGLVSTTLPHPINSQEGDHRVVLLEARLAVHKHVTAPPVHMQPCTCV